MKKIISLSLAIITTCSLTFAQDWVKKLSQENPNLKEIQKAFYKEWSNKPYEKGKGYKQFKRMEYFYKNRVLADASFPTGELLKPYKNRPAVGLSSKSGGGSGAWVPVGPFQSDRGIGRVNCVVVDPNNPNNIFVGSAAGGAWKSTDDGSTWTPISDQLSSIGINQIAIDPTNSNIMYIATGDRDGLNGGGPKTFSFGVMKSIDGGTTWNETGFMNGSSNDILINPTNPKVLWVASSSGMMKSIDAGETWVVKRSGNYRDIEMKPGDSNTVYAVTSNVLYKTTDGNTFSIITTGILSSTRLALAVTPANPAYVYILSAGGGSAYNGIYRSTDSGNTFTVRNSNTDLFDGATQAWYDMAITVSDTDPERVFTGALNIWKSTNGGSSWSNTNSQFSFTAYTHADVHYLRFYNGNLYTGTDGGVYKSSNNASNFSDLSTGLQISQFYRIAVAKSDITRISGGLQDNGGWALKNGNWGNFHGGDGMESAISPTNKNLVYGMSQFGNVSRSSNGGQSSSNIGDPGVQGNWVTPMQMDPNGSRLVCGYNELYSLSTSSSNFTQLTNFGNSNLIEEVEIFENNSSIIYFTRSGSIYMTSNNGATTTTINGDLPNFSFSENITSIESNPSNSNEIWITISGFTASRKVFHTTNGGANWVSMSDNLPNVSCNMIKYSGINGGLYAGTDVGVYYRDNTLNTWVSFSNQLPNVIVSDIEIHQSTGKIIIGTFGRGVWQSNPFQTNTLDASIAEITAPTGTFCSTTFSPKVKLTNVGSSTLTSANIAYTLDGGSAINFAWTGSLASGQSEIVILAAITTTEGTHTLNVATDSPNNGMDQNIVNDNTEINFNLTLANAINITNVIANNPGCGSVGKITVNAIGGSNNLKYSINGGTSFQFSNVFNNLSSGSFNIVVTDGAGCLANSSSILTTASIPTITSGGNAINCSGQSVTISASGAPNYSWNTGEVTASIEVSPSSPTNYTVTGMDGACVGNAVVINVTNEPSPIVVAGSDVTTVNIQANQSINFNSFGATAISYLWDFGDGTTSTTPNPNHFYYSPGNYAAVSHGTTGSCTATDTVFITVTGTAIPNPNTVSVQELQLDKQVNVYPNPSTGSVWLDIKFAEAQNLKISVLNYLGQVVKIKNLPNIKENLVKMDLNNLTGGIYFMQLNTEKTQVVKTISILK